MHLLLELIKVGLTEAPDILDALCMLIFFSCLLVFLVAIQTRKMGCCLSDLPTALMNLILNLLVLSEMLASRFPVVHVDMRHLKCCVALNHFLRICVFGRTPVAHF